MKQWLKKHWSYVAIWWLISIPYIFVAASRNFRFSPIIYMVGFLSIAGLIMFFIWGKGGFDKKVDEDGETSGDNL